ncbi:glycoside hydrolase family 61 protein [Postia placenta MAD-698-R-SB12]|uniref:lytic cellulose monooxygenase (C4-dehydrogenating) n=1 Tax=Postia placenta MAD-698-R-SB12 TaxID=670580 RepID=A0A1X6N2G5_9APHY|nr:glycoside hydrolase family 61 protein [Postia placenta MAD-698-R-SB12]OSX62807.1 glycoside hydrolase family 61 protein [Postia placenta MAD-698-R-SB12]
MLLLTVAILALHAPRALAHGYVSQVLIDGNMYMGNSPGHYEGPSPIRTVTTDGPVQNTSASDLACGVGAGPAQLNAVARPGSVVNITWVSGSGGNWPHEVGPVLTYLTACGNISCVGFNTSGARWFMIAQAGKNADGVGWVQQDIMEGSNFNVTLPDNLAPGGYLLRNEIIGLQNAMTPGGAEFFPSCTQLRVIGNATGVPPTNDTVLLPGAYSATDPSILVDAYTNPNASYVFPGPPIATLMNAPPASAPVSEYYDDWRHDDEQPVMYRGPAGTVVAGDRRSKDFPVFVPMVCRGCKHGKLWQRRLCAYLC